MLAVVDATKLGSECARHANGYLAAVVYISKNLFLEWGNFGSRHLSNRGVRLGFSVPVIVAFVGACASTEPPREEPVRVRPAARGDDPVAGARAEPAPVVTKPDTPPAAPASPPEQEIPADARIVMQRTACYGACPTYMVQLTADGTVTWDGKKHVRKEGEAEGSISSDDFATLWRALAATPFADLPQRDADLGTPLCPDVFSDHPTVKVTLESGGEQKYVHDYRGCQGNPALHAFRELETRIDEVAGTEAWIER